jgi:hypothetical protein
MNYALYSSQNDNPAVHAISLEGMVSIGVFHRPGVDVMKGATGIAHVRKRVCTKGVMVQFIVHPSVYGKKFWCPCCIRNIAFFV